MSDGYWVEAYSFILDYQYPFIDSGPPLKARDLLNMHVDDQIVKWLHIVNNGFTSFHEQNVLTHEDRISFLMDNSTKRRFYTMIPNYGAFSGPNMTFVTDVWLTEEDTILYKMKFNPIRMHSRATRENDADILDVIETKNNV